MSREPYLADGSHGEIHRRNPRRLQQLVQEGVVPKSEGRGRYNPIAVNLAYIRYLRDRVQSPELSVDEFFTAKLAKIKSEREMVELEMSIKRRERVPIDVVTAVNNEVAMAIAGILRANVDKVLTRNLINEIFEQFSDTPESLRWNLPADPLTIQVFRDPEYGRPIASGCDVPNGTRHHRTSEDRTSLDSPGIA